MFGIGTTELAILLALPVFGLLGIGVVFLVIRAVLRSQDRSGPSKK